MFASEQPGLIFISRLKSQKTLLAPAQAQEIATACRSSGTLLLCPPEQPGWILCFGL